MLNLLLCALSAATISIPPTYAINTPDQLASMNPTHNYILVSDIDLINHKNWQPLNYSGNFDGRGHTINNLQGNALFDTLEEAIVQNLNITNAQVTAGSPGFFGNPSPTGILANKAINSRVTEVTTSGTVLSENDGPVGGFIGEAFGGGFKDCSSDAYVEGRYQAGGFVGLINDEALIMQCKSHGNVYGDRVVGGFVGAAHGRELAENAGHKIKIIDCHSYGAVESKNGIAGGFAGSLVYTFAGASSAKGDQWSAGPETGGFVGRLTHRSRITNSYACGDVTNIRGGQTGGFVGLITYGSGIEYALSSGDVRGQGDTGGFAGAIAAPGAPNTLFGVLSFAEYIEGGNRLVGRMDHDGVNNCYAYLGGRVVQKGVLMHVNPNPYGVDGGDFNGQTLKVILTRLGWDEDFIAPPI